MTAILVVLIIFAYIDTNAQNNKDNNKDDFFLDETPITTKPDNNDIDNDDSSDSPQEEPTPTVTDEPEEEPVPKGPIVLAFAGDVNLDEDSKPVARYDKENKGILGGIGEELVKEMNDADIFMLNNEFAYSTRGTEIIEKSYTFRHILSVEILKEMGGYRLLPIIMP